MLLPSVYQDIRSELRLEERHRKAAPTMENVRDDIYRITGSRRLADSAAADFLIQQAARKR